MSGFIDGNIKPQLTARAAANLPQTTTTAYFTVNTGKCLILGIYGEVTTVIQAGANSIKLISNPTTGADVDLCTALDIASHAAGTMYNITGTLTDALVATTSGAFKAQANGVVVAPGTIDLNATASKTGQIKWHVVWLPLEVGASITSA